MIEIKNITIHTTKDSRTLIQDFNLSIQSGDKLAFIGEEGNGKSTLLKLIYDEQLIADYCTYEGKIIKNDYSLGFLSQELTDEEKQMTITDYFIENNWNKDLLKAMNDFGIESLVSEQKIGVLSGGERFKYRFLQLLALDPDVLLLDEPTNDLDIQTMEWLEVFIQQTARPILLVSHDETFISNTANGIIHMEQTQRKQVPRYTISREPYETYLSNRANHLNKQEQVAKKQASDHKKQMNKWNDVWQKAEHQHQNVSRSDPRLQKKIKSLKNQKKRIERATEAFQDAPSVEEASEFQFDSTIHVHNSKKILDFSLETLQVANKKLSQNIHLSITGPEKVTIIGENGVGKTTLLKKVKDELIQHSSLKIGYMPQNYEDLLDLSKTPIEFLDTTGNKEAITKAFTHLGSMKFTSDEMHHSMENLSGGQKAKLLILKMILDQCEVLILDEPTRNFSPLTTPVLCSALTAFEGVIISISHDRRYLNEVATTIYELTSEGLTKI
ncbi:ATP-binding cassette domain-containing protein [Paenibacillus sp. N3/727]|uniref:ATP-binding cassette domain-containing protein n=1 Tax=Paenibacillus sp. N3/727 TaxID=2925845 RepID=UPI001F53914F|nr:ATP-binding cassette domain-containing protein [Paenibacillus sp. N3/727]UNK17897.1 ATP-binding cassette domain-containing protein [Paenibacillus sp. N3/727]